MAENISKLYSQVRDNNGNYVPGSWYNDTDQERYNRVINVLDARMKGNLDDQDVRWFIKCAIINNIYISEGVYQLGDSAWRTPGNPRLQDIRNLLATNGYVTHKEIDIEKYRKGIRFEHMVPYNEVINILRGLFSKGLLTFEEFQRIRSKNNVCLVTEKEEKILSKNYRQKMPTNTNWLNNPGDEFVRYTATNVKI